MLPSLLVIKKSVAKSRKTLIPDVFLLCFKDGLYWSPVLRKDARDCGGRLMPLIQSLQNFSFWTFILDKGRPSALSTS